MCKQWKYQAEAAVTCNFSFWRQCRLLMKMWAFVRHNVPKALMFDHKKEVTIRGIAEEGKVGEEKDDSSPSSGLLRKRVKTDETSRTRSGLDAEGTTSPLNENLHLSGPALNGPSRKVMGKQALDSWISWDDKKSPCPSFSRYLYFYLAPTLIYKDQYPRQVNNYNAYALTYVLFIFHVVY